MSNRKEIIRLHERISQIVKRIDADIQYLQQDISQLKCKHKNFTYYYKYIQDNVDGYVLRCDDCQLELETYPDEIAFQKAKVQHEKDKLVELEKSRKK